MTSQSNFDPADKSSASTQGGIKALFLQVLSVIRRITPLIWATVIVLVIIPLIGQFFIVRAFEPPFPPPSIELTDSSGSRTAQPVYDWARYEQLIKDKLRVAHNKAEAYASSELDSWIADLTTRIDDNFLDWYFGYLNVKRIEHKAFFIGIAANIQHWLDPTSPTAQEQVAEALTEEFQIEFAKRVLVPEISQLRLESIATKTAKTYLNSIQQEFNQIPVENQIPIVSWERYLKETAIDVPGIQGEMAELTLQKLTLGGGYLALKPAIAPLIPKVGSAVAVKLAGKAGAEIAAKTGTVVAAKIGSTLLDVTVGAGILFWDIWDTNRTANIEKPILRQNLIDYLQQVKDSVLENPDSGIMTVIDNIDQTILQSIHIVRDLDSSTPISKS